MRCWFLVLQPCAEHHQRTSVNKKTEKQIIRIVTDSWHTAIGKEISIKLIIMANKVKRLRTRETHDEESSQKFQAELFNKIANGFTTLGVALGSRIGLFHVMSTFTEPKTSQEIADAAKFKERYVREWLGMMCTGNIIDLDDSGRKYYLPEHRRGVLTGSLGVFSWMLPMLGSVEDDLAECFKLDGPPGLPPSCFPRFQVWREKSIAKVMQWDSLGKRLTFVPGLMEKLEDGIELVDLGTGCGAAPLSIAARFPKSTVWGMDISEEGIARATATAKERGLKNAHFKVQDICNMPADWTNRFDFMCMYDVAHDVPFTRKMFKEILRTLKPGAYFFMNDIDMHTEHKDNMGDPEAPILYGISLYHCMPQSLNVEGSEGWGAAWGREKAISLLEEAGFVEINVPQGLDAICRKPLES